MLFHADWQCTYKKASCPFEPKNHYATPSELVFPCWLASNAHTRKRAPSHFGLEKALWHCGTHRELFLLRMLTDRLLSEHKLKGCRSYQRSKEHSGGSRSGPNPRQRLFLYFMSWDLTDWRSSSISLLHNRPMSFFLNAAVYNWTNQTTDFTKTNNV